ncbi:prenyltransferase/squalene oxidase repeat-containing protein [Micromonospora cathayae]|uniref:Prenyltransferase/squalene oxidase repeat-containing protein n=1 Tax=Micromonospora cathayae TaxID=3028804 RepID=A0ABY7ZMN3_9ACTN|nr:prenyltransferase/squalene oxidase repeat-containing protein [Micromonospora sp. HUAS 3]WDZ84167.1 prenyltransferase/squalene oxidase repeat-containing protein [Micromonospora sp. HUAS 3]
MTVAAARSLVDEMTRTPTGRSSVSVYETGRLVSLSPWLTLHVERIRHLLDAERPDGGWGGPDDGYALVPTLSATEGLLAALRRGDLDAVAEPLAKGAVAAVDRGLVFLRDRLATLDASRLPDMPAVDLIVPALVEALAAHLAALRETPVAGLEAWRDVPAPPLPPGLRRTRLERVRAALASGHPLPEKLLHALEVTGPAAHRAAGVAPVGPGTVGASPAATAAWLGTPDPGTDVARRYLEAVVRQYGGPVPCTSPISVFERSWVVSTLIRAGLPVPVPATVLAGLRDTLGPTGTATAPGLPADADTTSVTLYALATSGQPVDPSSLWSFDTGEHFCTWPGEDGASITTNAHVLDALGWHLRHPGPATGDGGTVPSADRARLAAAVHRLSAWLADRQEAEGSWCSDRWHASPYYATWCAVLALHDYGVGPAVGPAVQRAVRWVLAGQHADGSWGRWGGTAEETAYALQVLCVAGATSTPATAQAVDRGRRWLSTVESVEDGPALWHDKDLYRPSLIVRAAVLAATWLGRPVGSADPGDPEPPLRSAMIRIA